MVHRALETAGKEPKLPWERQDGIIFQWHLTPLIPAAGLLRPFMPTQIQILPLLTKTWSEWCKSICCQRGKLAGWSSGAIQSKAMEPPIYSTSQKFSEPAFPIRKCNCDQNPRGMKRGRGKAYINLTPGGAGTVPTNPASSLPTPREGWECLEHKAPGSCIWGYPGYVYGNTPLSPCIGTERSWCSGEKFRAWKGTKVGCKGILSRRSVMS